MSTFFEVKNPASTDRENKSLMLIRKIRAMARLPVGFSHGEGVPVRESAIASAERLISLAALWELDADVFPNMDGGCAVAFYRNDARAEASISPDGNRFELRLERGIGFQFEDVAPPVKDVDFQRVEQYALMLWLLDETIWKLSESSISASSTGQLNDSEISSTDIPQSQKTLLLPMEEGGFRSSMQPVLV